MNLQKMSDISVNKVLFLYPNTGSLRIPLAVSILTAIIRKLGIDVKIFDTSFLDLEEEKNDYVLMESRNIVKKTKLDMLLGDNKKVNLTKEIKQEVANFHPDIIMVSTLERGYKHMDILVQGCKQVLPDVPILAGGILATIFPDILLDHPCIDYVCNGEGEQFVVDFIHAFPDEKKMLSIPGMVYRNSAGEIKNNYLGNLTNMQCVPEMDWDGFDLRHLLKPYDGKVWIGGSFEFSRGCYKKCTFCVAPSLRGKYQDEGQKQYHRSKTPEQMIQEIKHKKEEYHLTFLAMCDTDFLSAVKIEIIEEFCNLYKTEIGIPWIMQTSPESFTERKLKALVDSGCVSASLGVESGSDHIRKNIIKKYASKERMQTTFDMCRDYNFRTTANFMIGMPYETEEDIWETIKLARKLNPPSMAICYFTPFLGTSLYDLCMKEGFYDGFDQNQNVYKYSPLKMPQISQQRIEELVKIFTDDFNSYKQDINNISDDIIRWNNDVVEKHYA